MNEVVRIPIAVSARHVHLTRQSVERLFGNGHQLRVRHALTQPGQFAAEETVAVVGPRGRLDGVRIVGPTRSHDQVELSMSDEWHLGIDAPVRESGDLAGTPGLVLEGPAGRLVLGDGVISALRHIHMSPDDARQLGLKDQDRVEIAVDGTERPLTFADVVVRVSANYRLELHLDTDEGNAAAIRGAAFATLTGKIRHP
jgi:acetate kinase